MSSRTRRPVRSHVVVFIGVIAIAAGLTGTAAAAKPPGFKTTQAPMLNPVLPRAWVDPIVTTGEMIGGYRFEALPDGIALSKDSKGRVEVLVNHETSTVPFPYSNDPNATPPTSPTQANSQNDFDNAQLSRLLMNRKDATIADASMVITSERGFQRFCSNFLAGKEQGFKHPLLLTNEEAVDWVNRTVPSWPAVEGSPAARQSGAVIAYDPETRESRPIWGMGRLNHENSLALPGYKRPVVVTGDDTFVNSPQPVADVHVHGQGFGRGLERHGRPVGVRLGRTAAEVRGLHARSTRPAPRPGVTSSRCRSSSRPVATPTART